MFIYVLKIFTYKHFHNEVFHSFIIFQYANKLHMTVNYILSIKLHHD